MNAVSILRRFPPTRGLVRLLGRGRSRPLVRRMQPFLSEHANILDIGAGTCNITELLREHGHTVTPLDVENLSFIPSIQPQLYDGKKIPFADHSFDVALVITVLHHIPKDRHEALLQEARRVAHRVIIIEDVVSGRLNMWLTWILDSVTNLEFFGHPHSNRTIEEWALLLQRCGFTEVGGLAFRALGVIRQLMMVLE